MEQPNVQLRAAVPEILVEGKYADVLAVSHTPHGFTLDFGVMLPNEGEGEDGMLLLTMQVVSRVRIAPNLIFDVIKTLGDNLDTFEQRFGPIQRPVSPLYPPEEQT